MDIFEWVKDIENVYEELIEKTKEENLEEIKAFRNSQEENMEELLSKKQEIVNSAIKTLSLNVNQEIEKFDIKLNESMNNIKENYQKNKNTIKKVVLEKVGLDF